MTASEKYLGKYSGTVSNNVDPLQTGRIQAIVPDVSKVTPTTWAKPCVPVAGFQMGAYLVPPVGAGVWIEFEQGDPDYPIWVGCWWKSSTEVPALALAGNPSSPSMVFQTQLQNSLVLSDVAGAAGGIMLKSSAGAMILVNDTGITISNGKGAVITLIGNAVDINAGALTVL